MAGKQLECLYEFKRNNNALLLNNVTVGTKEAF